MSNPCPICADLKFRKTFDELIAAGGDLTAAKKLCENELILPEGKICSTYRVKEHVLKHSGVDLERIHGSFMKKTRRDPAKVAEERIQRQVKAEVVETYLDEVASINVDKVLADIGVSGKPTSMDQVLTLAQEMGVTLNMLAGAIAVDSLKKYALDPYGRPYPTIQLKGAVLASEMMSTAFGYSQAISVQSALDTVERAGYEVVERGVLSKPDS